MEGRHTRRADGLDMNLSRLEENLTDGAPERTVADRISISEPTLLEGTNLDSEDSSVTRPVRRGFPQRILQYMKGERHNWELRAGLLRGELEQAQERRKLLLSRVRSAIAAKYDQVGASQSQEDNAVEDMQWEQRAVELQMQLAEYKAGIAELGRQMESCDLPTTGPSRVSFATPPETTQLLYADELTEEARRNADEILSLAIKNSGIYVAHLDKDLRYTYVFNQPYGMRKEDVIGKTDLEVIPPGYPGLEECFQIKKDTVESGEIQRREITLDMPGVGQTSWMMTTVPTRNKAGEIAGLCMATVDISEHVETRNRLTLLREEMEAKVRVEKELRKAIELSVEAAKSKANFLAVMSHEIRTPLNGVLGLIDILSTTKLETEQQELVDKIVASGDILLNLVNDILHLSKMESGSMALIKKPFKPGEIVQELVETAAAAAKDRSISITCHIEPDVPDKVVGDSLRLKQILNNLLSNAIKFTKQGAVTVRLRFGHPPDPLEGLLGQTPGRVLQRSASVVYAREVSKEVASLKRTLSDRDRGQGEGETRLQPEQPLFEIHPRSEEPIAKRRKVGTERQADRPSVVPGLRQGPPECAASEGDKQVDKTSEGNKEKGGEDSEDVWLSFEVIDTGMGIPEEAFPLLFQRFTQVDTSLTRQHGGTGLGLAICKQLVELMGGGISVSSQLGRGSTFRFSIRCAHAPKRAPDASAEATVSSLSSLEKPPKKEPREQSAGLQRTDSNGCTGASSQVMSSVGTATARKGGESSGPRILLVEDNHVNVVVASSMLKRMGISPDIASNGVEAIAALKSGRYDLCLMDICMPLMDGLTASWIIRNHEKTGVWRSSKEDRLSDTRSAKVGYKIREAEGVLIREEERQSKDKSISHLPIIAMTANAMAEDIDKCFAHGMDSFVAKPVTFQKLRFALERFLPH